MNTRRLAVLLLGAWLGCTIFMGLIATNNLQSVDAIMKHPSDRIQREMRDIGLDRTRLLLRFHAAELNRTDFFYWEMASIAALLALFVVLLFATNGNKLVMALAAGMLVITVIQHFTITPNIVEIGRGLDFATPDEMIEERRSFASFHSYYGILEVLKLAMALIVAGKMLFSAGSSRNRRRSRKKLDAIDDADDGHVDG